MSSEDFGSFFLSSPEVRVFYYKIFSPSFTKYQLTSIHIIICYSEFKLLRGANSNNVAYILAIDYL